MQNQVSLKRKSLISVLSLFFQSGYSALLGLVANIALTILLSPAVFGIYITVLSLISLLNYFSDIGLAASLIQQKEITDEDVSTAFTIQQILVITAISIGLLATEFVKNFYTLPLDGVYLYWALLFGFFLSSLKTIPSVFLERKIQFQKIVLVQVVENTVFYISVIILAMMGFELLSFAFAVITRAIIGVILIYSLSFWVPRIGIHRKNVKLLVSFGLPFQSMSFLALIKDDLVNLFLGKVVGFTGLGYIGWAKKWGEAPLRIIMDSLSRVMFPLYSRIQDDASKLAHAVEKSLFYQTLLLFPATVGFMVIMPKLIEIIPKYHKWQSALPLFYFFAAASLLSSFSTPFINMFNALGKVKISLLFMLFWTTATWMLIVPATKILGYYGFPLTTLLLSSSFIVVLYKAKKAVDFRFLPSIIAPLICGVVMGMGILIIDQISLPANEMVIYQVSLGIVLYFISLKILFKINLIEEAIRLFHSK